MPRRKGFTLIELLVVISIIALLISILLPALRKARDAAKMSLDMNQQRQIATAANTYAIDHDGKLPPTIAFNGTPGNVTFWSIPFQVNRNADAAVSAASSAGKEQRDVLNNGGAVGLYLSYYCPDGHVFVSPFLQRDPTNVDRAYREANTKSLGTSYFLFWNYGGFNPGTEYEPPTSLELGDRLLTTNTLYFDGYLGTMNSSLPFPGGIAVESGTVPRFGMAAGAAPLTPPQFTSHAGYKDGHVEAWNTVEDSVRLLAGSTPLWVPTKFR